MTEKQLTNQIVKALRAEGAWVMKTHTSGRYYQPTQKGLPDIVGCIRGYFFALEVKLPGKHATKLQAHELYEIRKADGHSYVITSVEQVQKAMDFASCFGAPTPNDGLEFTRETEVSNEQRT
jgi:Holliday junction resolvase